MVSTLFFVKYVHRPIVDLWGCWVVSTSIFGLILYHDSLGGNEYHFDLHIFFSGGSGFGGLTFSRVRRLNRCA